MTDHACPGAITNVATLVQRIAQTAATSDNPIVGISGHAGAGKSTVARDVVARLDSCVRVRVDDFLDPAAVHRRSTDWDGVDRARLADEVLAPFKNGRAVYIRPLDWDSGSLGQPQLLPPARILCVEGIGLFHPSVAGCFDLRVWITCDPQTALTRGKERDRAAGQDHDMVWSDVWFDNDRDFDRQFNPRRRAHLILDND